MDAVLVLVIFFVVLFMITSFICAAIYDKMPKKQLIRGRMKIKDFYLSLHKYAGGYLLQYNGYNQIFGKILDINITDRYSEGRNYLKIECAWTAERKCRAQDTWTYCKTAKGEDEYFNAFWDKNIYDIEERLITTDGEKVMIVDGATIYYLVKPESEFGKILGQNGQKIFDQV